MLTCPAGVASDGTVVEADTMIVHEKIIGAARLGVRKPLGVTRSTLFAHNLTTCSKVRVFTGTRAILRVLRCAIRATKTPEQTFTRAAVGTFWIWCRDKRTLEEAGDQTPEPAVDDFAVCAYVGVHALARAIFKLTQPAGVQLGVELRRELVHENRQTCDDERRDNGSIQLHFIK